MNKKEFYPVNNSRTAEEMFKKEHGSFESLHIDIAEDGSGYIVCGVGKIDV